MPNFEQEIKKCLGEDSEISIIKDNTVSFDDIDFEIKLGTSHIFIDAKEKKTKYRSAWVDYSNIKEENLFILDELGIKKLFLHFPYLQPKKKINKSK